MGDDYNMAHWPWLASLMKKAGQRMTGSKGNAGNRDNLNVGTVVDKGKSITLCPPSWQAVFLDTGRVDGDVTHFIRGCTKGSRRRTR
jgi:hypothetical protein